MRRYVVVRGMYVRLICNAHTQVQQLPSHSISVQVDLIMDFAWVLMNLLTMMGKSGL